MKKLTIRLVMAFLLALALTISGVILSVLAFFRYGIPNFKVGDCIQIAPDPQEIWEKPQTNSIFRIKEIGKEKYHMLYVGPKDYVDYYYDEYIRFYHVYRKVGCP